MPREVRRIFVFIVLAVCLGASCGAKQLAVIVDKSNNVGDVSSTELVRLFKLDSRKWPNGKNVVLVLRDPSTPEMKTAMQKLYHMQLDELKKLLEAQRNNVVIVKTEQDLLKSVESIPGAVGLVDVYSITSHVRVLKVDGKLPLEPGYYLKGK